MKVFFVSIVYALTRWKTFRAKLYVLHGFYRALIIFDYYSTTKCVWWYVIRKYGWNGNKAKFQTQKIGKHYNSVVRARMGYNTSLMLTNFFTIFVPQHGHFHGRFVTLKWVLFVRPWYIRWRIEKNNTTTNVQ